MNSFLEELNAIDQYREQAHVEGLPALDRLAVVARRDSGQARTVGRFLLALYNGRAYPFDLTQLRGLDLELFRDCLAVLCLDHYPEQEVHEYLEDGDVLFAHLRNVLAGVGGAK